MSNIYDLADTWNDSGTTFTAIKMNVTDSASAAASLLADLQIGGTSKLRGTKGGLWSALEFALGADAATPDVYLKRDAANTLAQRNGTNAQNIKAYNTYTDASNYERVAFGFAANSAQILHEIAGTGTRRRLTISGFNDIMFAPWAANSGLWASSEFRFASNLPLTWSSAANVVSGAGDVGLARSAAGVLKITAGTSGAGSLEMTEQTAPAAGAANTVRIYAEDNGSGKTRLMALFNTGAAQQIAIEP